MQGLGENYRGVIDRAYDTGMSNESITRAAIQRLLTSIEMRDLRAVREALHPDATWQNVPHLPAGDRDAIMHLLHPILCWSDRVQWDVLSSSVSGTMGWYERLDRFWLAGTEYAVPCNGVLTVDPVSQTVLSMRDYADVGEWRSRVEPALNALANRDAEAVVARHLEAVKQRDPVKMAADYHLDATLQRANARYCGWYAIADYFGSMPSRLGTRILSVGMIESPEPGSAKVSWEIAQGAAATASGTDTFRVTDGRISHQLTELDGADF